MIFIILSCELERDTPEAPVAVIKIVPDYGNTLTNFLFDGSDTRISGIDTTLFFRWDFDGDGIWETPFTEAKTINHNYNTRGVYYPKMMVKNNSGLLDTIQIKIVVIQGNSPPMASFDLKPPNGNLITVFSFDASKSIDREDSLNTLRFRWDWESDGIWDTEFLSEPTINHVFIKDGIYKITLEVEDVKNLRSTFSRELLINLHNPDLYLNIEILPDSGTTDDIFIFDASECKDLAGLSNTFQYKWILRDDSNNLIINTDFTNEKIMTHQFTPFEYGTKSIRLTLKDEYGMMNSTSKNFIAHYSNLPPTAGLTVLPKKYGNLTTDYWFRGACTDPDEWPHQLNVRWDFEGDGIWDTEFIPHNQDVYHTYHTAGEYQLVLEAMDAKGLTDISDPYTVIVSSGTNETSLVSYDIYDVLSGVTTKYYHSIVKIGDQWWTSENMNIPRGDGECYKNHDYYCQIYGPLYSARSLLNLGDAPYKTIYCPDGWHLPTENDWDILIDFIGDSIAVQELVIGGSSDFNALFSGFKNGMGYYSSIGNYTGFWANNIEPLLPSNCLVIELYRNRPKILKRMAAYITHYPYRCVKND